MDRVDLYGALDEEWQRHGLDRRRFLRLVAMGASITTISGVIAACGQATPAANPTTGPAATQATGAGAVPTFVAKTVGTPAVAVAPTSAPLVDRPFLVALNREPDSLDVQDTFFNASLGVDKCLYEGLVGLDERMQIVNQLAESWEPSADAKTFTFKLKQGVKFHDGSPFNAAAVQAAFERVLAADAKLKRHGYFSAAIDHVEAVDDGTVRLVTKQPFAALVATIAHPAGGIPSPSAFKQYGEDFGTHPVGTGPYKFAEWVRGDHIALDAYPDYWDKSRGASVSRLTIKGISDPTSLGIAVQSGGAQFAGPLNAPQAEQLQKASGVKLSQRWRWRWPRYFEDSTLRHWNPKKSKPWRPSPTKITWVLVGWSVSFRRFRITPTRQRASRAWASVLHSRTASSHGESTAPTGCSGPPRADPTRGAPHSPARKRSHHLGGRPDRWVGASHRPAHPPSATVAAALAFYGRRCACRRAS